MVVPKMEYLQALSMYCVSSMTINCRSQQMTRLLVFKSNDDLHAGQPVSQAGHHLFNQRADAHRLRVNGNLAGIEARRGEQARGQFAQQPGLLVDEGHQFGLRRRQVAHLAQAR